MPIILVLKGRGRRIRCLRLTKTNPEHWFKEVGVWDWERWTDRLPAQLLPCPFTVVFQQLDFEKDWKLITVFFSNAGQCHLCPSAEEVSCRLGGRGIAGVGEKGPTLPEHCLLSWRWGSYFRTRTSRWVHQVGGWTDGRMDRRVDGRLLKKTSKTICICFSSSRILVRACAEHKIDHLSHFLCVMIWVGLNAVMSVCLTLHIYNCHKCQECF